VSKVAENSSLGQLSLFCLHSNWARNAHVLADCPNVLDVTMIRLQ